MKMFYILFILCFLSQAVAGQKNDNPAFYLSTLKKKLAVILEAGQFKAGDRVADIGAGNGWFAAALGIYIDSVTFILEDIDSVSNAKFEEAMAAYQKKRGEEFTSTYRWVIGKEKSTTLAKASVDKILLIDTYHHIEHRQEMIRDLANILRPEGKLIVMEPIARNDGEIYKGCNVPIYTPETIVSSFTSAGFIRERTLKTVKSTRKRVRVFVFRKSASI